MCEGIEVVKWVQASMRLVWIRKTRWHKQYLPDMLHDFSHLESMDRYGFSTTRSNWGYVTLPYLTVPQVMVLIEHSKIILNCIKLP